MKLLKKLFSKKQRQPEELALSMMETELRRNSRIIAIAAGRMDEDGRFARLIADRHKFEMRRIFMRVGSAAFGRAANKLGVDPWLYGEPGRPAPDNLR